MIDHAVILYSCTFLWHFKIVIRWKSAWPQIASHPMHFCVLTLIFRVIDWGFVFRNNNSTGDISTCGLLHYMRHCFDMLPAALYALSLPLPMEVNTDVIFSLFHWSLVPHGAVQLAFSLKVNFIWTTPALVLACCFSVLRSCLYWLLWNEITPHCKVGLSPVGHS